MSLLPYPVTESSNNQPRLHFLMEEEWYVPAGRVGIDGSHFGVELPQMTFENVFKYSLVQF